MQFALRPADTFETVYFFIRNRPSVYTKPVNPETALQSVFFRSDRFGEFVRTTETGYRKLVCSLFSRGLETSGLISRVALGKRNQCAIAYSYRFVNPNRTRVDANIKYLVSAYPDSCGRGLSCSLKWPVQY